MAPTQNFSLLPRHGTRARQGVHQGAGVPPRCAGCDGDDVHPGSFVRGPDRSLGRSLLFPDGAGAADDDPGGATPNCFVVVQAAQFMNSLSLLPRRCYCACSACEAFERESSGVFLGGCSLHVPLHNRVHKVRVEPSAGSLGSSLPKKNRAW